VVPRQERRRTDIRCELVLANRDRLLDHDLSAKFFAAAVAQARAAHLMSHDHFTVEGTLIEAMASLKSFRRKNEKTEDREPPGDPGNPTAYSSTSASTRPTATRNHAPRSR
jgi:hypothetical protein